MGLLFPLEKHAYEYVLHNVCGRGSFGAFLFYGVFALDGRDEGYFLGSFCVVLENGGTDFSYRCIGKHLPFCH